MGKFEQRKEWNDLDLYLWRVRDRRRKEWPDEVLIHGSDMALKTLIESLLSLLDSFKKYGKGTRRFKCNPPKNFDFEEYGKKVGAKFDWFDWLSVKLAPAAEMNPHYTLEAKNVILRLDLPALEAFIAAARSQIGDRLQYPHGRQAPGGLYFAPDWLGAE